VLEGPRLSTSFAELSREDRNGRFNGEVEVDEAGEAFAQTGRAQLCVAELLELTALAFGRGFQSSSFLLFSV